jgi:hypothetical protein
VDENSHRRQSIFRELMTWAYAMPRLIRRIDSALCLKGLTETQKFDLETMADRIGIQFRSIQTVIDSDGSYERLLASMERLREEIATSEATLDRLLVAYNSEIGSDSFS